MVYDTLYLIQFMFLNINTQCTQNQRNKDVDSL